VAFQHPSFWGYLWAVLYAVIIDWFLVGIAVASTCRLGLVLGLWLGLAVRGMVIDYGLYAVTIDWFIVGRAGAAACRLELE
jgi:hypothetical protein